MSDTTETRQVWDIVVRLTHWLLVLTVISGWLLGRFGPPILTYHYYLGYAVAALVVVRVIWGFVGTKPARFASFLYGPKQIIAYARHLPSRAPSHWPGHNPIGAWSVFALLAVLIAQVATGLIADPDDFVNAGPLADQVSFDTARWASGMHRLLSNILLALVALHLAAILYYRFWKRENLVRPMVTGVKEVRKDHPNA